MFFALAYLEGLDPEAKLFGLKYLSVGQPVVRLT